MAFPYDPDGVEVVRGLTTSARGRVRRSAVGDHVGGEDHVAAPGLAAVEAAAVGELGGGAGGHVGGDVDALGGDREPGTPAGAERRPVAPLAGDDPFAGALGAAQPLAGLAREVDAVLGAVGGEGVDVVAPLGAVVAVGLPVAGDQDDQLDSSAVTCFVFLRCDRFAPVFFLCAVLPFCCDVLSATAVSLVSASAISAPLIIREVVFSASTNSVASGVSRTSSPSL